MRTATLTLAALLWAGTASALPFLPPFPAPCGCTWQEIAPEPSVSVPDPGWDAFQGTAEEKAAAQLADLLHEPSPELPILELVCLEHGHGGQPGTPQIPQGGGGQPEGGSSVPEPASLVLAALGVGVWYRRARHA